VVFGWVYSRTGGSLLVAILLHVGAHVNNPTHGLPGNPTAFVVYTVAIAIVASALVLGDRGAWPRRIAARADARSRDSA
jgi:hypothetical protein